MLNPFFPSLSPSIPNVSCWVGKGELANTNALRAFSPLPQVSHILLIIIKWLSLSLLISFECRYYTQHTRIIILSSKILGNWGEFPFPLVPQRYAGNSLSQSFGEVWECGHHSWEKESLYRYDKAPQWVISLRGFFVSYVVPDKAYFYEAPLVSV